MTTVEVFAPAKINLTLHVTGQQDDGYHVLDSLVVFADIGDTIRAEPADHLSLTLCGPHASGLSCDNDNLVLRAARFLDPNAGARVTLTKRLPLASGIGGGSADAAATLRALSQLWNRSLPPAGETAALGADVPVCLASQTCRMQGIGENLIPMPNIPACDILLVNPGVQVPTGAVFSRLKRRDNPAMTDIPRDAAFFEWLAQQRNDLTEPAIACAPHIAVVLSALQALSPLYHGMSGSGATCFALFPPNEARTKHHHTRLCAAHPDWWCAHGKLL